MLLTKYPDFLFFGAIVVGKILDTHVASATETLH